MKRIIKDEESTITEYDYGNNVVDPEKKVHTTRSIHYNHYCQICNKFVYEGDEFYKNGKLVSSDDSVRKEIAYHNKYITIESYDIKIKYRADGMDICNVCINNIIKEEIDELLKQKYKFKVEN